MFLKPGKTTALRINILNRIEIIDEYLQYKNTEDLFITEGSRCDSFLWLKMYSLFQCIYIKAIL